MRARQLEVFCAIMREGTLTNAAKALNISQPALSQVLRHAEDELGFALFNRVKGRLVPTPDAHDMYPEAERLILDLAALRRKSQDLKAGRRGLVRLAASPPPAMSIVPEALAAFRAQYPTTTVRSEIAPLDTLTSMLLHGDANLVLCMNDAQFPGLVTEQLGQVGFVCLLPERHALLESERLLSFRDLEGETLIAYRHATLPGQLLARQAQREGLIYRPDIEIDVSISAISFVQQGLGVAVVDALLPWRSFLSIEARPLASDLQLPITLLTHAERDLSIVENLMRESLRSACAKIIP